MKKTQVSKFTVLLSEFLKTLHYQYVGKYAGIIAGAFYVGQFLSKYEFVVMRLLCSLLMRLSFFISFSFVWGTIADAKGRKPVLIVSSILSAGMSVAFGFSVNFPMAVFTRFLAGFLNGKRIAM